MLKPTLKANINIVAKLAGSKLVLFWRHIILDPALFSSNHTYRKAKIKKDGLVGLDAFPRAAEGVWQSNTGSVSLLKAEAVAPKSYDYEGRHFNFDRWHCTLSAGGKHKLSDTFNGTDFQLSYTTEDGFIEVHADALYYWDFGVGGGDHIVIVDAYNKTSGQYMTEDFVDVSPDGELTPEVNAVGGILTGNISNLTITARNSIRKNRDVVLKFQEWIEVFSFGSESPTHPTISGAEIKIKNNDIIIAEAYYEEVDEREEPLHQPDEKSLQGYIIGKATDGGFLELTPSGVKKVPPLDPRTNSALKIVSAIQEDQQRAIEEIKERLESLERQRKE
jgi:hypothetical protein